MFPWNIAKSAEAFFSRWAVKKFCKFLLKKKLGQLLLGEIDIDQLEVQLSQGTIQLNDLALNVDFLNQKLGSVASLAIKEGSIGSLLVRIPWKGRGCTVEVEEIEIVVVPSQRNYSPVVAATLHSGHSQDRPYDSGNPSHDNLNSASQFVSGDVHEGVKTVAKMVKWFLTSFNVKLKKLIIAYDPHLENADKSEFSRTLVLRVSEIECGTCVSDDTEENPEGKDENFFGISRLTNFVKFEGVALELLRLDDDDGKAHVPSKPSSVTTPIVTGKGGGFSGNVKLSIPWKNGSLDIRRVDSDVSIDPIELQFQPGTIKWLLHSWEAYKKLEMDGSDNVLHKTIDPGHLSSRPISAAISANNKAPACDGYSSKLSSAPVQDSCNETRLSGPHLISDWVPSLVNKNKSADIEEELEASVDQFFECFDELRNSQSVLGNSGMWNWTCSVFSAITAASSLASGSLHIPSEQQHVETSLKAKFAGVSVFMTFQDEDQKCMLDSKSCQAHAGSYVPYLGVECQDILLSMQVSPRQMRYEGTIKLIEMSNYLSYRGIAIDLGLPGFGGEINSQNLYVRQLQADVQGVLPPLTSLADDSDESTGFIDEDFPFGDKHNVVKVTLLKTHGTTSWQFTRKSSSCNGSVVRSAASFEVELAPFVFWVDFSVINALLEMLNEVSSSVKKHNGVPSREFNRDGSSGGVKRSSSSKATTSSTESLRGSIMITKVRVVLCFPFKSCKDFRSFATWDQFLALDFNSGGIVRESRPSLDAATQKMYSSTDTRSLRLKFVSLDIVLISPVSKDNIGINSGDTKWQKFLKEKILTVTSRKGRSSVITIVFQDGTVTGPWIAKKAKSIVTSEVSKSSFNVTRKDYEFASVSTVNDLEDSNSQTRNEMILSCTTFLHICLSDTVVELGSLQYKTLNSLVDQVVSGFSSVSAPEVIVKESSSVSQTSILVECTMLEIMISPDVKENIRALIQSELPGSWRGLRLQVQKFTLLSVSNIGGICGANFFWLAHAEGKLWGSVTGVRDEEFLLISCNNSTMKRGDGAGSNALSSRLAGCDIVHLWDPECCHDYTSITLRCGTVIAVGGRLDWVDAISSFFSGPAVEAENADSECMSKGGLDVSCGASFVLNLVDIGLSYEPYVDSESSCSDVNQEPAQEKVACLLAASSLNLSNLSLPDSVEKEFRIRVQDLGLLIRAVSKPENATNTFDAERLQKTGYVKVAREALVEAILRTNCRSGLMWEVECSKSHIYVETRQDTTASLIRLAGQLQQLFVPDLKESVVHLQDRWDRVQLEQEMEVVNDAAGFDTSDCNSSPSTSELYSSSLAIQSEVAFQIEENQSRRGDSSEEIRFSFDENFLGELGTSGVETPEILSSGLCFDASACLASWDISQNSSQHESSFPHLIERYCFPELQTYTDNSTGRHLAYGSPKDNFDDTTRLKLGKGNSGWYGDATVSIVEDHISELTNECNVQKVEETTVQSTESIESIDFLKPTGRVLLKNIDVRWRMNAGCDWQDYGENGQRSKSSGGRDSTGCLELALDGIEFQFDVFPLGGTHVSKLALSVQDFHLYDMSRDAPWKLVLGYYESKDHRRKSSSKALKLNLETISPDPLIPLEEYRLRVAFLPMRLHLHQSQVDFLIGFFGAKSSSDDQPSGCHQDSSSAQLMPVNSNNSLAGLNIVDEALLPYFQSFDIWPILLRVDYNPSHVDLAALRGGKYVELVNLVPWKGVELKLPHIRGAGMYGWGSVCETAIGEWLEDISQNQVHKILRGLPPIRSVVALGAGAAKLVSLPVKSYRKDKKVLKGMQRGITAFLRSISVEAVGLGVHLAAGAHDILLQAEYMVTNNTPSVPRSISSRTQTNVRSNQPKDAQQGIQQAYESLSNGLEKSASALVQTPLKKYQRGAGAGSALAAAVRAVPAAAIAPASAFTGAVHYVLLGVRNSLDPERKKESMEKYLGPAPTQP